MYRRKRTENLGILSSGEFIFLNLIKFLRAFVRVGEHDLSKENEARRDIEITKQIKHQNYDRADGHSNLAILVLNSTITFTSILFYKNLTSVLKYLLNF